MHKLYINRKKELKQKKSLLLGLHGVFIFFFLLFSQVIRVGKLHTMICTGIQDKYEKNKDDMGILVVLLER